MLMLEEKTRQLGARLRTKMRYGSKAEVLRAAYEFRLHLETEEEPSPEVEEELEQLNRMIDSLETRGINPLERRVRHWIDYLGEIRDRFGGA